MADTLSVETPPTGADVYTAPDDVVARAHINSFDRYREMYLRSIEDPDGFWSEIAEQFYWKKKWNKVRSYDFDKNIDIKFFEGALASDRYAVIKFFMHIDRDEQKHRLDKFAEDEATSWRVREHDWEQNDRYDEYLAVIEQLLARTETEWAPWTIVEAHDRRWARLKVIETVIERLDEELQQHEERVPTAPMTNGAS